MLNGKIPPQAYTKDTLSKAFMWLQTQSENVRKTVDTPDAVVSLYLRAKRLGLPTLEAEAPVSAEDFKSSLKTLAAEMQKFEDPRTTPAHPQTYPTSTYTSPSETMAPVQTSVANSHSTPRPSASTTPTIGRSSYFLDARTLETLSRVMERLNLSTETEALRLLVILGAEKLGALG